MPGKTYTDLLNEGLDLYHEGKFWEGYELITANADHVPHNDAQVYDFRASLACRAGRPDLALELLTEAVMDKNCWYTQEYLGGDDDIAPIASHPDFGRLREACASRESEARTASESALAMVRGSGGDGRPLIIVLHGNMQNIPICQEDWGGIPEQGFDLAFIRSSQLAFSDAYVWTDLEVGTRDLKKQIEALRAAGELEGRKIIMAGFSAGARMALYAVMNGMIAADAMVLVGPWLPEMDRWSDIIRGLSDKVPGVHIICGDRDEDCLPGAKLLADTLDLAGRSCRLSLAPGIGHYYPKDFASCFCEEVLPLIEQANL